MPREREAKLSASPAFAMPSFDALGEGITVEPQPAERLETVYLDTRDLRLARWGVSLRHRSGQGWTVKLPDEGTGVVAVRPEYVFEGEPGEAPPAAVDLVRAFVRGEHLAPVARLRTVRRRGVLRAADGSPLVDIADDEVSVLSSGRLAARFRELEAEIGDDTSLDLLGAVVAALREAGAGDPEAASKYLRAVGPRALEPPDVDPGELPANPSAGDVLRLAIASSVDRLIRHDPVARVGEDPEGIHQMRVSARHLHSQLRTFVSMTSPVWAREIGDEVGWLAGALGALRDADVMLDRLRTMVDALPETDRKAIDGAGITDDLIATRESARRKVLRVLRSDRYLALLDRLVDAAASPVLTDEAAGSPASLLLLADEQRGALRTRVKAAGDAPAAEELHRIRVEAKRCRYATDALVPVAGKPARAFSAAAADLQGVLGDQNDAVVMEAWIRAWAGAERPAAVAFAAGELAERERATSEALRGRWRKAWKAVAACTRPRDWA